MTDTARDLDDFLATIDDVLTAADVVPSPAPGAAPEAALTMPDVDLDLVAPADAVPVPVPARAAPAKDWWNDVYKDDAADQDTFTGNIPAAPADDQDDVDDHAQSDEDEADDEAPAKKPWPWSLEKLPQGVVDEADDPDGDRETDETPKKKVPRKSSGSKVAKAASTAAVAAGNGLINNPRGRRVIFAATAYGVGRGLHLDDWATGLMTHAADYALPVAGCTLLAGITCLAVTPSKAGCIMFVGSLALIGALEMISPAHVVGGSLALGCQIAYRILRHWVGHHGDRWPWKGVLWAGHIPAATTTVALLLYGTN